MLSLPTLLMLSFLWGGVGAQGPSVEGPGLSAESCLLKQPMACEADEQCRVACGKEYVCRKCQENKCRPESPGVCLPSRVKPACKKGVCSPDASMMPACKQRGCGGEKCVAADEEDVMAAACVFKAAYECYNRPSTRCGSFGIDGACEFEQTPELLRCLREIGG